jgi:hypothetical protein
VNRSFHLKLTGEGNRDEIVEFAHQVSPLNGKPVCVVATFEAYLGRNCAKMRDEPLGREKRLYNAERLACSASPCSTHFHACRAILHV